MSRSIRIVHYLNQFFGQLGSEDKADLGPTVAEGPVGPGILLQQRLGRRGAVVATLICGDNYLAERPEASREAVALLEARDFDLFVAGPAFNAGRYGIACGRMCAAMKEARGVPGVAGMFEENPAVEEFRRQLVIARCGATARSMADALSVMADLALKLGTGSPLASPEQDRYVPQGRTVNVVTETMAAQRAVDMLVARVQGRPYATEIPLPAPAHVTPAPALRELANATIALVTEGGLVPTGNPDRLVGARAGDYRKYSLAGRTTLPAGNFESVHRGFDTSSVNADPNRIVPLDAARQLEREGVFKRLHDDYYVTSGCATWIESSKNMAARLAGELREAAVDAVIFTAT